MPWWSFSHPTSKAFEPLTQTANNQQRSMTGLIIARENRGKSSCIADANSPELVGEELFNRLNWFLFYESNKELILTIESIRSYICMSGDYFFFLFLFLIVDIDESRRYHMWCLIREFLSLIPLMSRMLGSVVAVAFQITFYTEMHVNDFFYFLKIIFDISISKQSKKYKLY